MSEREHIAAKLEREPVCASTTCLGATSDASATVSCRHALQPSLSSLSRRRWPQANRSHGCTHAAARARSHRSYARDPLRRSYRRRTRAPSRVSGHCRGFVRASAGGDRSLQSHHFARTADGRARCLSRAASGPNRRFVTLLRARQCRCPAGQRRLRAQHRRA